MTPLILNNTPCLVKRVVFAPDGAATLQVLTVTREVALSPAETQALCDALVLQEAQTLEEMLAVPRRVVCAHGRHAPEDCRQCDDEEATNGRV